MGKTTTTKSETASTLDVALSKIDALLEESSVRTFKTREEFDAFVTEEIAKAEADANVETKQKRLGALKAAIDTAKAASWEEPAGTQIKVYVDPWYQGPTVAKTATTPTNLPAENGVAFSSAVSTVKSFVKPLLKSFKTTEGKASVAKAGEAMAALTRLAQLFGLDPADEDLTDCEFRWDISDAISALQQAANLEALLAGMAATMGAAPAAAPGTAPVTAAAPATEAPAPAAPAPTTTPEGAQKSVTKAAPAEDKPESGVTFKRAGAHTDADGWPLDFNA